MLRFDFLGFPCPDRYRATLRRDSEHDRVSAALAQNLEKAQLQESRVPLDQMGRVGEVPKGSCFAARSFKRGETLLPRLHDLREDFLDLSREHDVLDLNFQ